MARGNKTVYHLRNLFLKKVRLNLLNALIISHLESPSLIISGTADILITTLTKQLS